MRMNPLRQSLVYSFIILLFLFGKDFNSFGQSILNNEIQLEITSGSTEKILKHIEEKAGVIFSYSNKVCISRKVVLENNKGTIKQFLDQIFNTCYVEYTVIGNKILILPVLISSLKFRIQGFVKDSLTGEVLIYANIFDLNGSKGTVSNDYGFYNMISPGGEVTIGCSYIGYESQNKIINLKRDTIVNFNLIAQPALQEIPVFGNSISSGIRSSQTSIIDLPVNKLQNVPSFMGEMDLVKMIQLFPGIQSGNDGFSGLYVRGGGKDQNLILLDDVPIYNVEHLLGFFSVFNPDAINSVKLIKGGFPAQYGGRLSSVIDIKMLEGNNDKMKVLASLGLISSKLALEGPFKNKKTTYSVSFRRTYYDLIAAPLQSPDKDNSNYYFFDLNAKANHQFSDKSRLFISTYWGHDELKSNYNFKEVTKSIVDDQINDDDLQLNDEINSGWGNVIASSRWNYIFNNQIFSNTTISYSNYNFNTKQEQEYYFDEQWNSVTRKYKSGIMDLMAKIDFDYSPKSKHYVKFGGSYIFHQFYPGIEVMKTSLTNEAERDTTIGGKTINGSEFHLYFQDDFSLTSFLKINAGMHCSMYYSGSKKYYSVEPRLSSRFLVTSRMALKFAYSAMSQYIHLLNTANVSLPTDLWLPVTDVIKPMRAWQVAIMSEYEFRPGFNISTELYYKRNFNLLDYKESQSFFDFSTSWADKLTTGKTNGYGMEILAQRTVGNWTGWLGYTYSKNTSNFPELNNGEPFPSNNDRRHDVSMFLSHRFNEKIDANATWVFASGKPVTLSDEKYYAPQIPTSVVTSTDHSEYYLNKNGYNMPNYHRLDIGVNFYKKKDWGKRIWSFGIMNVYGRQNPIFLYYSDNKIENGNEVQRSLKQFSLFPFPFPYIRYTIQF